MSARKPGLRAWLRWLQEPISTYINRGSLWELACRAWALVSSQASSGAFGIMAAVVSA